MISIATGLVLSPIIGLFGGLVWYEYGGKNSGGTFGFFAGLASFALIVWKLPGLLVKALDVIHSKLPEPIFSCVEFGTAAALFVGGVMVAIELLLGHMRPPGWEVMTLLAVISVFTVFACVGWRVGLNRKPKT